MGNDSGAPESSAPPPDFLKPLGARQEGQEDGFPHFQRPKMMFYDGPSPGSIRLKPPLKNMVSRDSNVVMGIDGRVSPSSRVTEETFDRFDRGKVPFFVHIDSIYVILN